MFFFHEFSRKKKVELGVSKLGVCKRTVERQIQTAKNLTPEAKEIIKKSDTKISKKGAMELSRLKPEQQKEAATLLVSGEIQSIEEYTAAQPEPKQVVDGDGDREECCELPTSESKGRTFAEDVAYMKSNDKDTRCTPKIFLADVGALTRRFQQHVAWYSTPYYENVFPMMSREDLAYLRQQMDSICHEADQLYDLIERQAKI